MKGLTTREVAELVGLSPDQVRAFARAGLLSARREDGGRYEYEFRDVVLLRSARALQDAGVSGKRIWHTLRDLRAKLPRDKSLTSIRVVADDRRLLVHEDDTVWHPETGQYRIDFSLREVAREVVPLADRTAQRQVRSGEELGADDWFNFGVDLELFSEVEQATKMYRQALEVDPAHPDAHNNLGRLLQDEGRLAEAEACYRAALESVPDHLVATFNLATVFEDRKQFEEAERLYRSTLDLDPDFADANYNLAGLLERRGETQLALQHLKRYKALVH